MKKTAVLLYPGYSMYEIGVALSVLAQGKKSFDIFALDRNPVRSEDGVSIVPDYGVSELVPSVYDSLLLPGEMDCMPIVSDSRYADFVSRVACGPDSDNFKIGSISSSVVLLVRAGLLTGKKYTCGIPDEMLEDFGFERGNFCYDAKCVRDGNILTARGSGHVDFGVFFGRMLGLDFNELWYR